jgi:hypothetical protein
MKKFKDFIKNVKINSGVAPEPVHFRMGNKPRKKAVKESANLPLVESKDQYPHDWVHDNENKHLLSGDPESKTGKEGSGKHAQDLSDHLAKKARSLSKEEARVTNDYCGVESAEINRSLIASHKKDDGIHPKVKDRVKHLDNVTRHPIGQDLHVYSGVGFDPKKHVDSSGHLHLPAYTSTTHHKGTAHWFAGASGGEQRETDPRKKKHVLHIHLKASDLAAHVSEHNPNEGEHETILPRNTTLKIHPTPTILSDGTHVWHARVHKQEKD